MNQSETKAKICLPIWQNLTLLKTCSRSYCQRWLRNVTSLNRENSHSHSDIVLQKRREKFQDQLDIEHDQPIEKYRGYLCRLNSTWTFRLINSYSHPYFGENLGLINHSKAIIVIQSKVNPVHLLFA